MDGTKIERCSRCGRSCHDIEKCVARYHINGEKIRTDDEEAHHTEEQHYTDDYEDDLGEDDYQDDFGYVGVHVGICQMNYGYHYNEEGRWC